MSYDAKVVYELRNRSGAGVMECKKALEETKGDIEKACELLRKKGIETAAKKQNRSTEQGLIGSYVHTDGKIGVLVEVNCETDFVARTEEFISFVKELLSNCSSSSPLVAIEMLPEDIRKEEEKIYQAQLSESGKPEAVQKKIIEGS